MKNWFSLLFAIFVATFASATDRYVNPTTGTDGTNTCASPVLPCASIDRCISQMTGTDDRCLIAPGTYTNQPLIDRTMPGGACTSGCSIMGNGGAVTLNYTSITAASSIYLWKLTDWNNLTIQDITITANPGTYAGGKPVFYWLRGTNNTMNRVSIRVDPTNGPRELITTSATTNLTIKNGTLGPITPCLMQCASNCQSVGTESCDYHCEQDQLTGEDDVNLTITNMNLGYTRRPLKFSNMTNFTLSNNHITDVMNHGAPEIDDSSGLIINNVYDTNPSAACFGRLPASRTAIDSFCGNDVTIAYNTFAFHNANQVGNGIQMDGGTGAPFTRGGSDVCSAGAGQNPGFHNYNRWKFYGNIVYNATGGQPILALPATGTIGGYFYSAYNLWAACPLVGTPPTQACAGVTRGTNYTCQAWSSSTTPVSYGADGTREGIGDVCNTPTFINYVSVPSSTSDDFHPQSATSPQVGAGSTRADAIYPCPLTDFDGSPRAATGACTIGAYEWQGAAAPTRDFTVTNCATEGTSATSGTLEWAIAQVNTLPAGGPASITFSCSGTIPITGSRFNNRVITQPNTTIDGGSTVAFNMTPPWWDDDLTLCTGGGNCDPGNTGLPTLCPSVNDGLTNKWLFRLTGVGDTVKNLTYRYFMEGLRLEAQSVLVDNVIGEWPGDDAASNPPGTVTPDVTIQNSTFRNACDKNLQLYGDNVAGASAYDVTLLNNTFENSSSAIRVSGSAGRFYIEGNTFRPNSPPNSLVSDKGPYIGDDGSAVAPIVYWKGNTVTGTTRGLRLTGATQFISLGGNTFSSNTHRGLVACSTARARIFQDTFTNNGVGSSGSTDCSTVNGQGGVAVGNTAIVDAGGGSLALDGQAAASSGGGNTFSGNQANTTPQDFQNSASGTMSATNNCWTTSSNPAASILGLVTFNPIGNCGLTTNTGVLRGCSIKGGSVH